MELESLFKETTDMPVLNNYPNTEKTYDDLKALRLFCITCENCISSDISDQSHYGHKLLFPHSLIPIDVSKIIIEANQCVKCL